MRWRRLCVDVDDGGNVLGGSVELYDDSQSGANAVLVASGGECNGHSPATLLAYLYEHYRHLQEVLPLEPY